MSRGPGKWQRAILAACEAAGEEWVPLRWLTEGKPDLRGRTMGMNPDGTPLVVTPKIPEWWSAVVIPDPEWKAKPYANMDAFLKAAIVRIEACRRAAVSLRRKGLISYHPRAYRGPVVRKCWAAAGIVSPLFRRIISPPTNTYELAEQDTQRLSLVVRIPTLTDAEAEAQ